MKAPNRSQASFPWIIATTLILAACCVELFFPKGALRLGLWTYNPRVKMARLFEHNPAHTSTNLGFLLISDQTVDALNNGLLGKSYGLYWPRHIYGRVLKELTAEGADVVAFDVLFGSLRYDHQDIVLHDGERVGSDDYFGRAIRQSGNSILAAGNGLMPAPLFMTNAMAVGHVEALFDVDGCMRRDKPYVEFKIWHPLILRTAAETGGDLNRSFTETKQLTRLNDGVGKTNEVSVTLKTFKLFREHAEGTKEDPKYLDFTLDEKDTLDVKRSFPVEWLTAETPERIKPFTTYRAWSMGILMAAKTLGLDLNNAVVDSKKHHLFIPGTNGVSRTIPLNADGSYYIDWSIDVTDDVLTKGSVEDVLECGMARERGEEVPNRWKGKMVLIGSVASGNDLTDKGSTPLSSYTYLASKYWNVANTIISDRFITPCPMWAKLSLIVLLGFFSTWITLQMRPMLGLTVIVLMLFTYGILAFWLYARYRFWLPVGVPLFFSMVGTFFLIAPYRIRMEQAEQKRVKMAFSRVLAPKIVNTLLTQKVELGGSRRELTVFFADIRGFTELTDTVQTRAEEYVREHNLSPKDAEVYFDSQAKTVLATVSQCLGLIAETIKRHDGTLDKYIGDCVMAFWGAPTADPQHALHAVRAAIEAQRALHALNDERIKENERITRENIELVAAGQPPKPLLSLISLGTGINTGVSIAGFMGSDNDILNYTVFGREINLAARLEGVSGHGRILIGEATYLALQRDEPALAATCIELAPIKVKGFRHEVKAFEVPWRQIESSTGGETPSVQGEKA